MSRIEVDAAELGRTARALRRSLDVARQVADDRGSLLGHLSNLGSERLADAAGDFLDRWAHGCSLVVDDGEALAGMLETASQCYLEVDAAAADAFGGGR